MKTSLSELYKASSDLVDFGKAICEFPTKIYPPHYCTKCGAELHQIYMESLVYLVACPGCETSTLVKAVSPINALMKVGKIENERWIPIKREWPSKPGRYLVTFREWSNGNYLPEFDETYVRILRYSQAVFVMPKCIDNEAEKDINREVIAWMHLPEKCEDYEDGF